MKQFLNEKSHEIMCFNVEPLNISFIVMGRVSITLSKLSSIFTPNISYE